MTRARGSKVIYLEEFKNQKQQKGFTELIKTSSPKELGIALLHFLKREFLPHLVKEETKS